MDKNFPWIKLGYPVSKNIRNRSIVAFLTISIKFMISGAKMTVLYYKFKNVCENFIFVNISKILDWSMTYLHHSVNSSDFDISRGFHFRINPYENF